MVRFLSLFAMLFWAGTGVAAPASYALDRDTSKVVFTWYLGKDAVQGTMPVKSADLSLDFADPAQSRLAVVIDVASAEAGFPFATQGMKGPKVLDAAAHPEIRFTSTRVTPDGDKARVEGNLTIRGVTRPAVFSAEIFRQRGTAAGDLSRLTVLLAGTVSRAAYGATGWSDLAGDRVQFQVLARIRRD